jgi:hypothetical protein
MNNLDNLKTMKEKEQLDPKEMMENGLTREQNEKLQKDDEAVEGLFALISGGVGIWILSQVLF